MKAALQVKVWFYLDLRDFLNFIQTCKVLNQIIKGSSIMKEDDDIIIPKFVSDNFIFGEHSMTSLQRLFYKRSKPLYSMTINLNNFSQFEKFLPWTSTQIIVLNINDSETLPFIEIPEHIKELKLNCYGEKWKSFGHRYWKKVFCKANITTLTIVIYSTINQTLLMKTEEPIRSLKLVCMSGGFQNCLIAPNTMHFYASVSANGMFLFTDIFQCFHRIFPLARYNFDNWNIRKSTSMYRTILGTDDYFLASNY